MCFVTKITFHVYELINNYCMLCIELLSDWLKAYSEFSKSVPVTSCRCRLYIKHVKDTQGHGLS